MTLLQLRKTPIAACLLAFLWRPAAAGTFSITNDADPGPGTLRQAVLDSNAAGTGNEIDWAAGLGGGITLIGDLGVINDNTTLNMTAAGGNVGIVNSAGGVGLGGAVTFRNDNASFYGNIASVIYGPGSLVKTGGGLLLLTGANSYTGGTVVNQGTLEINGDAALGAASGALTFDGGMLRIAGNTASARSVVLNAGGGTIDTFSHDMALTGAVTGAGGLVKIGAGTLTLSGTNAYAGGTTVAAGTLSLGADDALPPGGALTVAGSAAFDLAGHTQALQSYSAAGTTKIEIRPAVTNMTVTNNAALSGPLEVGLAPQLIADGQTFTPLTAGSVSGTFSGVLSPAAIAFDPAYGAGGVQLTARWIPFARSAATGNQMTIAGVLEPLRTNPTGDMVNVIGNLNTLDAKQLKSALEQIGPLALSSMERLGVLESDGLSGAVDQRVAALTGNAGSPGRDAARVQKTGSPWGAFASGVAAASYNKENAAAPEGTFHTGGLVAGTDFGGEHFAAGLLGGYLEGSASIHSSTGPETFPSGRGVVDKRSFRYGAYAAGFTDRFHANLYAGAAQDRFTTKRGIDFADIARTARAAPRGSELNVKAGAGYDFPTHGWGTFSPVVGVNWDEFRVGSFSEDGADALDLSLRRQAARSLRSSSDLRYGGRAETDALRLTSYLALGWRHEFAAPDRVGASLASAGGAPFLATGESAGRDGFRTGAGLSLLWKRYATTLHLEYAGDYKALSTEQVLGAGVEVNF